MRNEGEKRKNGMGRGRYKEGGGLTISKSDAHVLQMSRARRSFVTVVAVMVVVRRRARRARRGRRGRWVREIEGCIFD